MSKRSSYISSKLFLAPALVAAVAASSVTPIMTPMAHAQGADALVSAGRAGSFLSNLEAGQYDMTNLDKAAVENLLNNGYFAQNEKDLAFLQDTLAKFDQNFQRFLNTYINGDNGLGSIVAEAATPNRVYSIVELVEFANAYNAAKLSIETQINLLGATVESLPGGQEAAGGQKIPAPIRSDVEAMQSAMKAAIDQAVNNVIGSGLASKMQVSFEPSAQAIADMEERGITVNKEAMTVIASYSIEQVLALEFPDRPSSFTPEMLMDLRQAALDVRTGNDQHADFQENFVQWVRRNKIVPYRNECGEQQNWRWTSESEQGDCNRWYADIVDFFFYRSYLRNMVGMPLGIIGVENYEERFASFDRLLAPTNVLQQLVSGVVTDVAGVEVASKSYQQYLRVVEERAGDLFDGDVSVVANINAVMNRAVRGTTDLAQVNANVVKLLAADAYEETMIIARAASKRERQDFFRARWFEGEDKRVYAEKFQFIRGFLADSGTSIMGGVQEGSIQEVLQDVSVFYNDVLNRQARAQEMLAIVIAEENSGKDGELRNEAESDADDFLDSLGLDD
ncbi:MAG: hypothetical protein AAF202_05700 [Pseudomonadota bacterium]